MTSLLTIRCEKYRCFRHSSLLPVCVCVMFHSVAIYVSPEAFRISSCVVMLLQNIFCSSTDARRHFTPISHPPPPVLPCPSFALPHHCIRSYLQRTEGETFPITPMSIFFLSLINVYSPEVYGARCPENVLLCVQPSKNKITRPSLVTPTRRALISATCLSHTPVVSCALNPARNNSSTGMNHDYGRTDGRCLLDQREFFAGEAPEQRVLEGRTSAQGIPCWQLKTW